MKIHVLPTDVVDQIAAGEVVERPSHMIKELVENSLDAGATHIHVEWSQGGREVRIIDDGAGIASEELGLALDRHATSKISLSEDLWKLNSFGFRGEALASIAAVSKLTLTSRPETQAETFQIYCEFGKKHPLEKVSGQKGTVIRIEHLFQNTPARLKFLKSDAAESAQIKNTLKALAMAHPLVEFRAQENGKLIFFYPKAPDRKTRVENVLEVKPLYTSSAERDHVKASAVYADPHQVGKTAKNIWLFAQGRWIQDRSLQVACLEAYRSLLMHGEYPICVVWLETDPAMIDVNIHPTKSQVKFQDASLAFRAVQASLRDGLEKAPWLPPRTFSAANLGEKSSEVEPVQQPTETIQFSGDQFERTQFKKKNLEFQNQNSYSRPDPIASTPLSAYQELRVPSPYERKVETTSVSMNDFFTKSSDLKNSEEKSLGPWSSLEVIGQAHLTYLVCQGKDKIVFVDQHAAHERVAYERLMTAWKGGKIDVQDFLFPLAIDLSPEKVESLLTVQKDLEKLGVFIEQLGPGTVGVKAAPIILKESIFGDVFERMSQELLDQGGSYRFERIIGDLCATMACHSVVRAGQSLSLEQMKNLLKEMDENPLSSFCPHGRPVSVEYPIYKLEKDFGRIV